MLHKGCEEVSDLDQDVKIYTLRDAEEVQQYGGEQAAAEYVALKSSGKIDRARVLGGQLADCFAERCPLIEEDSLAAQKISLCAYLLTDLVERIIPGQLLQKTVLASFQESLEDTSQQIAAMVADATAFTFYRLNQTQNRPEPLGEIFAELCGNKNEEMVCIGEKLVQTTTLWIEKQIADSGLLK